MKNQNFVTKEELRRRVKESQLKADIQKVTLPKGTKEKIQQLQDKKVATFCRDVIMKAIEELEKQKE